MQNGCYLTHFSVWLTTGSVRHLRIFLLLFLRGNTKRQRVFWTVSVYFSATENSEMQHPFRKETTAYFLEQKLHVIPLKIAKLSCECLTAQCNRINKNIYFQSSSIAPNSTEHFFHQDCLTLRNTAKYSVHIERNRVWLLYSHITSFYRLVPTVVWHLQVPEELFP